MKQRKIPWLLLAALLVLGILSPLVISKVMSSPKLWAPIITALDHKRSKILELTAGTTTASVVIAAIPGDATTPIASEIAKLNDYFVTALSAVLLEKYLLTVLNQLVFTFLVPAACFLGGVGIVACREWITRLGIKLGIVGLALIMVIPSSVLVSNHIEETYQISLSLSQEELLPEEEPETIAPTESTPVEEEPAEEKKGFWASVQAGLDKITTTVTDTVENATSSVTQSLEEAVVTAKQMLSELVEKVAILIVLNCLIPIATLSFFLWIVQLITGMEIKLPHKHGMTKGLMDKAKSKTE